MLYFEVLNLANQETMVIARLQNSTTTATIEKLYTLKQLKTLRKMLDSHIKFLESE